MKSCCIGLLAAASLLAGAEDLLLDDGFSPEIRYFHAGGEFPGADGSYETGVDGRGVMNYDFSRGGVYVGVGIGLALPEAAEKVSVRLRAGQDTAVRLRVGESGGRWFQSDLIRLAADREGVAEFDFVRETAAAFGGDHQAETPRKPLTQVMLLVEKSEGLADSGWLELGSVACSGERLCSAVEAPEIWSWQAAGWDFEIGFTPGAGIVFMEVTVVPGPGAAAAVWTSDFPRMGPPLVERRDLDPADGVQKRRFRFPAANAGNRYRIEHRVEAGDETASTFSLLQGRASAGVDFGDPRTSAEIESRVFGSGLHLSYGTSPSFTVWKPYRRILDEMHACGMQLLRDGVEVEKDPDTGRYRLRPYDREWLEYARSKGITPVIIVWTDAAVEPEEFAGLCRDLALDTVGLVDIFEMGNEPMNMGGWMQKYGGAWNGKEPDGSISPWVMAHTASSNAGADAIAAARPDAVVLAGSGGPPSTMRYLQLGLSPNIRGVVEHPYSFALPPEKMPYGDAPSLKERDGLTIGDAAFSFAGLMEDYRRFFEDEGSGRKVWNTEYGFSAYWADGRNENTLYLGYSEAAQAVYLVRRQLLTLGIPVIAASLQYDFVDDYSGMPFEAEANFGLLRSDYSRKPSYYALQRFNSLLADSRRDENATVTVTALPLHRGVRRGPLTTWDEAVIDAETGIGIHAARSIHGDNSRMLAVWSLLPYSGEFNSRAVSLTLDGWSEWNGTPVAIDLITGRSFDIPARLEDGRWMLEGLLLGNHPLLIRFVR